MQENQMTLSLYHFSTSSEFFTIPIIAFDMNQQHIIYIIPCTDPQLQHTFKEAQNLSSALIRGQDAEEAGADEAEAGEQSAVWATELQYCKDLESKLAARKYKSTLIIAPSSTLNVWRPEKEKFFPGITMRIFAGHKSSGPNHIRRITLGSRMRDLLEHLLSLPDDPTS